MRLQSTNRLRAWPHTRYFLERGSRTSAELGCHAFPLHVHEWAWPPSRPRGPLRGKAALVSSDSVCLLLAEHPRLRQLCPVSGGDPGGSEPSPCPWGTQSSRSRWDVGESHMRALWQMTLSLRGGNGPCQGACEWELGTR